MKSSILLSTYEVYREGGVDNLSAVGTVGETEWIGRGLAELR